MMEALDRAVQPHIAISSLSGRPFAVGSQLSVLQNAQGHPRIRQKRQSTRMLPNDPSSPAKRQKVDRHTGNISADG